MKKIALALAFAATAAAPAMAQTTTDTGSSGERPSFTGPHADVSIGWNRGSDRDVLPATGKSREHRSGVAVRGAVGYDVPLGDSAIVGAEVGIGSGGRDIRTVRAGRTFKTDPGFTFDITGRIGVKPSNNILLFGKGGYAFQRVKTTETNGTLTLVDRGSESGFLWGAGAEVALSQNVSLRADFDRVSFNDHYKRTRLLGGISYRF